MGKINKFLCRWFDIEDKGYVTIGDFIKGIICTILAVSLITVVIYSVIEFISRGIIYNNDEVPQVFSFYVLGGAIIIFITILVIILIIATIVTLIQVLLDVKIAECKTKKEREIRSDSFTAKYSMETIPLKTEMEKKI